MAENKKYKARKIPGIGERPIWMIVDDNGDIISRNVNREELKGLEIFPGKNRRSSHILEISENEILDIMKQFYKEKGRVPTARDFGNDHKYPSIYSIVKVCGSWNNALEMAGLWDKRKKRQPTLYTGEELLEILKRFETEYGRPATWNDINNPKYPSPGVYIRCFGSLEAAKKLIGQDLDSMIRRGIIGTNNQKARLAEIFVLEHFVDEGAIDLSGENRDSSIDGICPNKLMYDVKSSKLHKDKYWSFLIDKGKDIDFYYLLAFNEDWTELLQVWRIPWNFVDESKFYYIGLNSDYEYNLENMGKYEVTVKFMDVFENWIDRSKA